MEESVQYDLNVDCNSAILFLTDGKYNVPDPNLVNETVVWNEILDGLKQVQAKLERPLLLFT